MFHHVVSWKLTDVSEVLTASIITLMIEAVSSSEMSVSFYKTTQCLSDGGFTMVYALWSLKFSCSKVLHVLPDLLFTAV
jgi:hypothetical protein